MKTRIITLTISLIVLILPSCVKEEIIYPTAAKADFIISKTEAEINEDIQFTDASIPDESNNIVNWEWNFGTSTIPVSNTQSPKVKFTAENSYKITLTVTDNNGLKSVVSKSINIIDPANNVRLVWNKPLAEAIENTVSPALSPDGSTVYMIADRTDANGDLKLLAYTASNGSLKWEFNIDKTFADLTLGGNPRLVYCSPSVGSDGTVYIAIRDLQATTANRRSFFLAISPGGTKKWHYAFGYDPNFNYLTPAIDATGKVYLGGLTNLPFNVLALNPADGSVAQTISLTVGVRCGLALSKAGSVYFGSTGANGIYSFNTSTTAQTFNYKPTGLSTTGGSISIGTDGTVYTVATIAAGGAIVAINPDGSKKWEYNTTGGIDYGGVVIGADGTIYASGGKTTGSPAKSDGLVALKADGTLKWKFETTEPVNNCVPLVDNRGYIHFITDNGTYYVIKSDGTAYGSKSFGARSYSSPVMGSNGLVYIGVEPVAGTSETICINTRATGPASSAWPMKGQNAQRTNLQK